MQKNNKVFSNLIWRFAERCGAQGVKFVVEIILARILLPEDYGAIALVTVFITILNVFVDSGLGNALIQKKNADDLDFSSVFYFNILWCIILYIMLFVLAPYIANFYLKPELNPVIRILGVTIIISGVKNVQQAYVSCTMQFKRFFFSTLSGTVGAAIIGIVLAYCGAGVWALVAQQIFNTMIDTIVLWFTVSWRPKKLFSLKRLKTLFSYGWKLLASALINTLYTNIWQLIIGKVYSASDLAFYNKGDQFPRLIVGNINSSIDSVLLPALSQEQDSITRVKQMTRQSIKISVYIMAPLMMGLASVAPGLVSLVLTDKWLPCIPFIRIFCITYMFYPIHTANLNAIKALGRSDLFLKLEIAKKVVGLLLLLLTMRHGVIVMAYSLLFSSDSSQIINSWPNRKLLNYSYLEQLKDIIPSIILALFMGLCINIIGRTGMSQMLALGLQFIMGIIIYILGSKFLHIDSFAYLMNIVKTIWKNHRQ